MYLSYIIIFWVLLWYW